jgi:hypothetical protein
MTEMFHGVDIGGGGEKEVQTHESEMKTLMLY